MVNAVFPLTSAVKVNNPERDRSLFSNSENARLTPSGIATGLAPLAHLQSPETGLHTSPGFGTDRAPCVSGWPPCEAYLGTVGMEIAPISFVVHKLADDIDKGSEQKA